MKMPINHMPTHIEEQSRLALSYASDGAYNSAYRVLHRLTETVRVHADQVNAAQDRLTRVAPINGLRDRPAPGQLPPPPNTHAAPAMPPPPTLGDRAAHRHVWHVDSMNGVRTCEHCGAEEPL